jgi:hypothetical protein
MAVIDPNNLILEEENVKVTFLTISIPSTTCPKTTCLPSNQEVLAVQMKNWDPLVLGPALAILKMPEKYSKMNKILSSIKCKTETTYI